MLRLKQEILDFLQTLVEIPVLVVVVVGLLVGIVQDQALPDEA